MFRNGYFIIALDRFSNNPHQTTTAASFIIEWILRTDPHPKRAHGSRMLEHNTTSSLKDKADEPTKDPSSFQSNRNGTVTDQTKALTETNLLPPNINDQTMQNVPHNKIVT